MEVRKRTRHRAGPEAAPPAKSPGGGAQVRTRTRQRPRPEAAPPVESPGGGAQVRTRTRQRAGAEAAPPAELPDGVETVEVRRNASLNEFASQWLAGRDRRTLQGETQRLRDHVLPLLGRRRLRELRPEHVSEVVQHILAKKGINLKSAKNAYAVFAELLGDAFEQGLIAVDPRVLPPDIWPAEPAVVKPSLSAAEVAALTSDARLDAELRVFHALALYTGLAVRTLCGLRFADLPELPRAPFARELESLLERWQQSGFEAVFGRAPNAQDWLVPRRSDPTQPHSEGSAFKSFRRSCVLLGITPRSLQALRNTFEAAAGAGKS
jgi:integrase